MRSNATGAGFYNSEPRNFNRGFGRGMPKPFYPSQRNPSPQPQPPRKGDLFLEAGRLAVDYLVSRGLLSSNVVPGKNQNGNLRNNSGESLDRDSSRRLSNDQDSTLSRSYSRERRRLGPSRTYSSDWSRENEKEGSLTEEAIPSRDMEVDNDTFHKESTKDTDIVVQNSSELAAKDDGQPVLQNEIGKSDVESQVSSLVQNEDDKEVTEPSDAVSTVFEESKNGADDILDKEKDTVISNLDVQVGEEKSNTSPLMDSKPESDPILISGENNASETRQNSLDSKKFETVNGSEEISSSTCLGTAVADHSFGEARMLSPVYPDQQKSMESLSFIERSFAYQQKSSGLPDLGIFSSIAKDRGEKRPFEEENMMEGAKKAKQQWLSVARSDDYSRLSDLDDNHTVSPPKRSMNIFNASARQENFTDVSLPLKGTVESDTHQGEKQLLSSSFKICDLNLMEASDMHENHEVPALLYPTISGPNQNLSVDIDLSVRNNCSLTSHYNDSGSVRKNIEIIDLEGESLEGCKSSNTSMKSTEAGMTSMESFPNPQNSTDNQDGQDGYGFMISELLGNDVPNCSSVQPDMNTLHNDMGLNHSEGMFSEDDPIYMSLGEIPLTGLLRAWDQPAQERNPFEL